MEADVIGVEGDEREDGEQWVPEEVLEEGRRREEPGVRAPGDRGGAVGPEQHA